MLNEKHVLYIFIFNMYFPYLFLKNYILTLLDSIVVSIPACHAGDRGSIPRRGEVFFLLKTIFSSKNHSDNVN